MLKPRKKISKREIKEDPLVTKYFETQKFIQRHNKKIQIGLSAIIVFMVVSILMIRSKQNSEIAAINELGMAEIYYYSQQYNQAIEAFTQILESYSGTSAAATAVFLTANIYFIQEDYENAEKYFRLYTDNYHSKDIFTASSLAGLAACSETYGQYNEAAVLYENAGKKYPNSFEAPFHLKNAARCYVLAENIHKGKEIFQFILDKYEVKEIEQDVKLQLEAL